MHTLFKTQRDPARSAPGPIATNADASVPLWSFGTASPAHRSIDNGATWTEIPTFPKGAAPVADLLDPTRCYAFDTTTGTLFASADSGQTFTARATGLSSGDTEFQLVAAPGRSGDLWLSLKGNGFYRSTDGGATFTEVGSCHASHTLGFGKAARGASYPALYMAGATDTITAVHRSERRGEDLDTDQRRPSPVGLDRSRHHRRSPRLRAGLHRHQRNAARSTGSPPDARQRSGVVLTVHGA